MANTIDEIKEHAFFEAFHEFEQHANLLNNYPEKSSELVRAVSLVNLVVENVRGSERLYIPTDVLNETSSEVRYANSYLHAFISTGDIENLKSAISHASTALSCFSNKYRPNTKSTYKSTIDALSNYAAESQKKLEEEIGDTILKLDYLQTKLHEVSEKLGAESGRISTGLGNVETLFTESQSQRSTSFQNLVSSAEQKVSDTIQIARNEFSEALVENNGYYMEQAGETKLQLEGISKDSKLKHDEILKTYRIVGRDSQIGGYFEASEKSRKSAAFWDCITFLFLVVAIVMLVGPSVHTYFKSGFQPVDWVQALSRIPLTSVLLLPAVYAGAQARRQKQNAENARERQLELASLGPYLSTLPQPIQNRIKAVLTPRFFSGEDAPFFDSGISDTQEGGVS